MTELRAQEQEQSVERLVERLCNEQIVIILSLPLIFLKCLSLERQTSRLCVREPKRSHFKTGSLIGVKVYKMPLPAS